MFWVAMYFICSQKKIDDKDRFFLKFILTTLSAPVVILSIAIIIITLLNNQKIKKSLKHTTKFKKIST